MSGGRELRKMRWGRRVKGKRKVEGSFNVFFQVEQYRQT